IVALAGRVRGRRARVNVAAVLTSPREPAEQVEEAVGVGFDQQLALAPAPLRTYSKVLPTSSSNATLLALRPSRCLADQGGLRWTAKGSLPDDRSDARSLPDRIEAG